MNATETYQWEVNIVSDKGLVPSSKSQLPESLLTQILVAIWHHLATLSYSNLIDPWEIWSKFQIIFKLILLISSWGISCEIALSWISLDLTDECWPVDIGSGTSHSLMPSGNKPLPQWRKIKLIHLSMQVNFELVEQKIGLDEWNIIWNLSGTRVIGRMLQKCNSPHCNLSHF